MLLGGMASGITGVVVGLGAMLTVLTMKLRLDLRALLWMPDVMNVRVGYWVLSQGKGAQVFNGKCGDCELRLLSLHGDAQIELSVPSRLRLLSALVQR